MNEEFNNNTPPSSPELSNPAQPQEGNGQAVPPAYVPEQSTSAQSYSSPQSYEPQQPVPVNASPTQAQLPQSVQQAPTVNQLLDSAVASAKQNPVVSTVIEKSNMRVLLTGGIAGLVASFVLAIVVAVIGTIITQSAPMSSGLRTFGFINVLAVVLFGGVSAKMGSTSSYSLKGQDRLIAQAVDTFINKFSLDLPLGLVGLFLLVGCAAGVYYAAKKVTQSLVSALISSAVGAVIIAVIFEVVSLLLRVRLTPGHYIADSFTWTFYATGWKLFFAVFILAFLGLMLGYRVAQLRPGAPNIAVAAWDVVHRARGFVRTTAEFFAFYLVASFVAFVVLFIVLVSQGLPVKTLAFYVLFLPTVLAFVHQLGSFGIVNLNLGDLLELAKKLSPNSVSTGSLVSVPLWLKAVITLFFIVVAFYLAMRLAARNIYDRKYAGWETVWQAPVLTFVVVGIFNGLFASVDMQLFIGAFVHSQVQLALVNALILALWVLAIEVIARVIGNNLLASLTPFWKFIVGGTVKVGPLKSYPPKKAKVQANAVPNAQSAQGSNVPAGVEPTAQVVQQVPAQQAQVQQASAIQEKQQVAQQPEFQQQPPAYPNEQASVNEL